MAYWIVHQEIEHLDLNAYRKSADKLVKFLEERVGGFYRTKCLLCGSPESHVKYFLWVKETACTHCGESFPLFPGYLLSEDRRHPQNVFICAACGELTETADRKHPGRCRSCREPLLPEGPARRNRCNCLHCGKTNRYPDPAAGPPGHRMFAIEYLCRTCKPRHKGRFFKKPDAHDLARYAEASRRFGELEPSFIPDEEIPPTKPIVCSAGDTGTIAKCSTTGSSSALK